MECGTSRSGEAVGASHHHQTAIRAGNLADQGEPKVKVIRGMNMGQLARRVDERVPTIKSLRRPLGFWRYWQ